jgi:hypothetical protein
VLVCVILIWGCWDIFIPGGEPFVSRLGVIVGYLIYVGVAARFFLHPRRRDFRKSWGEFACLSVVTALTLWPVVLLRLAMFLLSLSHFAEFTADLGVSVVFGLFLRRNLDKLPV